MFEGFFTVQKAPSFPEGFEWINTKRPLNLEQLRGNVVVLDFWTYCCINCMHTLPTLKELEQKYEGRQVVFIGVHSGKFSAEQEAENVRNAVARYEIEHPVLVDKKMQVWNSFGVAAWPTIVIIDPNGTIVYKQSGEPQKETLQDVIEILLEKHSKKGTLARDAPSLEIPPRVESKTLSFPGKIAISKTGRLAISDSNHNRILIADLTGKVEHVIGSGRAGYADGKFDSACFFRPQGVAWGDQEIFVADTENHAIRKIDLTEKKVVTVAGTGRQGDWISAGGDGTATALSSPWDVSCKDNQVFIAMAGRHQLWVYDTTTKNVSPYAGTGQEGIIDGPASSAQLAQPSGLYAHNDILYFADSEVSAIRQLDLNSGVVSTLVGHGLFEFGHKDGSAEDALLQHPLGLCAVNDSVFVADTYNSSIRAINMAKSQVYTLIGKSDKKTACLPGNLDCDLLSLYEPGDVKYYGEKLYIADTNNHLIRVFDLKNNSLETLNVTFDR